jgi:hypothetical protein
MEEEVEYWRGLAELSNRTSAIIALKDCIFKAKELQGKEIVSDMTEANQKMGLYGKERWAVVDYGDWFDTKEAAQQAFEERLCNPNIHTIVKIITND